MKNNTKRILKVTIKRMIDESPDTSYLGEYSNREEAEFSIDRAHAQDCQSLECNHRVAVDILEHAIDHVVHADPASDFYDSDACDILSEAQDELQECDCSGGDMARNEYRYFNPAAVERFNPDAEWLKDIPTADREAYWRAAMRDNAARDYERMERLQRGDWSYIGIRAEAEVCLTSGGLFQEFTSGGLWGIESDSGKEYLAEVEQEELAELKKELRAVGVSSRAIATAFKDVERVDA